jgi:hypothetical protein
MNVPTEFSADHDSSAVLSQCASSMPYQHFDQQTPNFSQDHSLGEMPNLDIINNSQFLSNFDSLEGQSPWLELGAWNASAGFVQTAMD